MSSANEIVEVILTRVLRGQLDVDEAIERLSPYVAMDIDSSPSYASWLTLVDTEVQLTPADVAAGLEHFLAGRWSERELRRWAMFITHTGHYTPGDPPAEDEDYYDELWDVLNSVSSPEVFGDITRSSVEKMRSRLAKFV